MIFKKWVKNFSEYYYFRLIDDLWNGLKFLNFNDNFKSYTSVDLELSSGVKTEIRHNLGILPTGRIIIKQNANATFIDSDWDTINAYITSSANCTISIIYFV